MTFALITDEERMNGMTKIAFSYWNNRIAPVFDTAQSLLVVESENGRVLTQTRITLPESLPVQKALRLMDMGVDALVCGAISRPMHDLIATHRIQVISFVAGDLLDVVQAWLEGTLETDLFAMPGCRRRRWGGYAKEMIPMVGQGRGYGRGQEAGGRGRGGGPGRGRMGGPLAAGPTGQCVCPKCGSRAPHQPGLPCVKRTCPECGTALMRE